MHDPSLGSRTMIGVAVGSRMRSMQGFQVVMNFVMMPMFFLSGALFPLSGLPAWDDRAHTHRPRVLRRQSDPARAPRLVGIPGRAHGAHAVRPDGADPGGERDRRRVRARDDGDR